MGYPHDKTETSDWVNLLTSASISHLFLWESNGMYGCIYGNIYMYNTNIMVSEFDNRTLGKVIPCWWFHRILQNRHPKTWFQYVRTSIGWFSSCSILQYNQFWIILGTLISRIHHFWNCFGTLTTGDKIYTETYCILLTMLTSVSCWDFLRKFRKSK